VTSRNEPLIFAKPLTSFVATSVTCFTERFQQEKTYITVKEFLGRRQSKREKSVLSAKQLMPDFLPYFTKLRGDFQTLDHLLHHHRLYGGA
jgi:hypothetical protein